jgi:protein O-mannosyl-transferase
MTEFSPTRKNWKEPQPNPLRILFPEVTAWVDRGAYTHTVWICCVLALVALLVYAPSVGHDFVALGDYDYVSDNPHVAAGFTLGNLWWGLRTGQSGIWQPLTWLSHMRDCHLFETAPSWQHLNNILLHAANTVLLFFVLSWFTGERSRCAFVAALFAVHPLNVETVAWIAERKDLLGTFFFLLTCLAYGQYLERRGTGPYLLFFSLFALGLMASPIVVTLPLVLFLFDYWPLRYFEMGIARNRIVYEKLPFIALSILVSVATFLIHKKAGVISIFDVVPRMPRAENALCSLPRYLGKIFWPANLIVPYRFDETSSVVRLLAASILLLAISATVIFCRRIKPYLVTGWFWYLVTLLPVLGIVQVGPHALADRSTYIPAIGIFIAVTWLGADFLSRWAIPRNITIAVCALILSAFTIKTWFQNSYWENTETLFKHTLALDPKNYIALESLGDELLRQRRIDEAMLYFEWASRAASARPYPYADLGTILYAVGRSAEAAEQYEKALCIISPLLEQLRPSEREKCALFINNLAWLRATSPDAKLRNAAEARRLAEQSVALSQNPSPAQLGTLAAAQAENGEFSAAANTARQALAMAQLQHATGLVEMLEQCCVAYEHGRSIRQSPKTIVRRSSADQLPLVSLDVSAPPNRPLPHSGKTPPRKLPPLQEPEP